MGQGRGIVTFWHQIGVFFTTESNWTGQDGIPQRLWLQVQLSAAVIAVAALVGVGVGFLLGHFGRGAVVAVNAANAARAVPSLALLTLLAITPAIGLAWNGFLASFITLAALGIPPVLTNAYVGMREVDREVIEAARASGMTGWQSFRRVEGRLAVPLAVAGIRTAAVEVVATGTLAAYISYNDLGGFIISGFDTNNTVETFSGAIVVAVLAMATDLLLAAAYRFATPPALR
ncbi:MAG TPA: ABC transporter permease subunit, partial [Acidimicrobiales bacterium]|nr:ABC transporter permease subunit [Acidimicrobiales bacterium]